MDFQVGFAEVVKEQQPERYAATVKKPTEDEILALRNPLAELFSALQVGSDYSCLSGEQQLEVLFQNQKVGGLNRRDWHLYISKVFASHYGTPELLQSFGFKYVKQNNGHEYWVLEHISDHQAFRRVIEEMTNVPIQVPRR